MPQATNPTDGVKIHYEVEGAGPPLVLLHGFPKRLEMWREAGYVDALSADYHLVLIDARGHGQSGKPHEPKAYSMELQVSDVTSALDGLGIAQAHVFGSTLGGGQTCFGMLQHAPDRLASLIIHGMFPYATRADVWKGVAEQSRDGMEAYWADIEQRAGETTPEPYRSWVMENDTEALAAHSLAIGEMTGFADSLATASLPCLMFAGSEGIAHDRVKEAAGEMPNATFVSVPDLDGMLLPGHSDVALPHVTEFLTRVTAEG